MRLLPGFAALIAFAVPTAASASLPVGAQAPQVEAAGAIAGKPYTLNLQEQLKSGPVVLYFFPKAFTTGCDLEAHDFADHIAAFKKAGARVIGISADPVEKLAEFSTQRCASAFPVASASPAIIDAYDVKLGDSGLANRVSYVIGRDGKITFVHNDMDYKDHVKTTLAAVRGLRRRH